MVGDIEAGVEAEAWVGAEAWLGAWDGVIPIPSMATSPGHQDGRQHPMPVNMEQLCRIWDTVTHPMVPTTQPIHLTDGGSC